VHRWYVRVTVVAALSLALSSCGTSNAAGTQHSFNSPVERHRAVAFAKAQAFRRARTRFPAATVSVVSYIAHWNATRLHSTLFVHASTPGQAPSKPRLWEVGVRISPKTGVLTLTGIDEHLPETVNPPGASAP
jgi:hypothetical protein